MKTAILHFDPGIDWNKDLIGRKTHMKRIYFSVPHVSCCHHAGRGCRCVELPEAMWRLN